MVTLSVQKISVSQESVDALRKVVNAERKTSVYMCQLKETGNRSHNTEAELAVVWTELSFALQDLGVSKLAKCCYSNYSSKVNKP